MVSPDGVAPSRMVGVSASVNLPLHHKVKKFSSGTGSPGWSRKKGHKMVVVVWLHDILYTWVRPRRMPCQRGCSQYVAAATPTVWQRQSPGHCATLRPTSSRSSERSSAASQTAPGLQCSRLKTARGCCTAQTRNAQQYSCTSMETPLLCFVKLKKNFFGMTDLYAHYYYHHLWFLFNLISFPDLHPVK